MRPSSVPSVLPSMEPSGQPSGLPTQPSGQPSMQPSSQPSKSPSKTPSTQPSSIPSQPSGQPSCLPSAQPSGQPSSLPSALPSSQPTSQPSDCPSGQPSTYPTRFLRTFASFGMTQVLNGIDQPYSINADNAVALDVFFAAVRKTIGIIGGTDVLGGVPVIGSVDRLLQFSLRDIKHEYLLGDHKSPTKAPTQLTSLRLSFISSAETGTARVLLESTDEEFELFNKKPLYSIDLDHEVRKHICCFNSFVIFLKF